MPAPPTSPPSPPGIASRPTRIIAGIVLLALSLGGLAATADRTPLTRPQADAPATIAPVRINLNSASAAELELLPRIGPALSRRIVEDRAANGPFRTIEDLDRVRGIGPRTILNIRDHATVD